MTRYYVPRRASKRGLDAACPEGVLCITDNKGQTADRYTVIYSEIYGWRKGREWESGYMMGRNMSENPFHPQGVGMTFELRANEVATYRYRNKHHYTSWSSLPDAVKDCVRRDLKGEH